MKHLDVFSEGELKILKILANKAMMISEIRDEFYKGDQAAPLDPNNVIATSIRRINKKCELHKLPWFLNGIGGGRGGRKVWKDKR